MVDVTAPLLRPDFLFDLSSLSDLSDNRSDAIPSEDDNSLIGLDALGERLSEVTNEVRRRANSAVAKHLAAFPQTPLGTQISLFETLGFHREEVAHTRALAWLLDSRQTHGFGTSLLDALIKLVRDQVRDGEGEEVAGIYTPGVRHVEAEYRLTSRRRVDIFIEGTSPHHKPWRLLIEAKVDAGEGHLQLADYGRASSAGSTHLYLTPTGRLPQDAKDASLWIAISFSDLAKAFLKAALQLTAAPGFAFLQMYLVGIITEFCEIQCPVNRDSLDQPFAILHLLDETDG